MQDLGINPGTSVGNIASVTFTPPGSTTTTSSTTSTTTTPTTATGIPLNALHSIGTGDYSITLPSATATALLTDSQTKIIDDPQIRMVDGQEAKLRIGERVPVATGSFQAGVGVGATGTAGLVNPLVNTQFQYLDVGVIVDVTPRIHPEDHEVSLKLSVEVSSVSGTQNIGGINQPVISTKKIEHDVRLQDGEVNILGGLIEKSNTHNVAGWPGLSQIPFLKYFTSETDTENVDEEDLIVVTPHIIRIPNITAENLRSIASGIGYESRDSAGIRGHDAAPSDSGWRQRGNPRSARWGARSPGTALATAAPGAATPGAATPQAQPAAMGELGFEPATASLKAGETTTIGVAVKNAQDLFSVPLLIQYDPKVVSIEDVRQGGFLSGGGQQPIAVVQRVDKERGQAIVSATRMPNTPGVSGNGTIVGLIVRGVAAGNSTISILQVNARDSQQRPLQFATSEATVKVQ